MRLIRSKVQNPRTVKLTDSLETMNTCVCENVDPLNQRTDRTPKKIYKFVRTHKEVW